MVAPFTGYDVNAVGVGEELFEGDTLNLVESTLVHPSHTDGFADIGDPVISGNIVGVVVNKNAAATGDIMAVKTTGIFVLNVVASDEDGTQAVAIGDSLFIHRTTAIVSKDPNGALFGVAMVALSASASAVRCAVKVAGGAVGGSLVTQIQDVVLFQGLITGAVNVVTGFTFGRKVKVVSWHTTVTVLTAGACDLTFERAAVDLTETLTIADASAVGTRDVAIPTTDGEDIFEGADVLDVESDGVPTAGEALIVARVINL